MSRTAEPLSQAMALLQKLEPGAPAKVQANLDAFSPGSAELVLGYAFADILGRDGLDLRTREMLTVAMLAAMGTAQSQLDFHMRAAMKTGVTREEIVEIVLQVSVYAGVPACMNAITSAKKAFQAAGAN
ncbi:carboxymuconolactone decarboxylase family protein [Roseobacter sinensis]|uniref:Carboxymuconolactone decarboxylase family protein n=1 Tax=Roseobacter sinensis TaxID=2931391 RepID=A0ABT3BKW4_9RHOB|nr:carboxymuconolactone decarboxylase family protein [Roseobacter sp. WL0113]MCV3274222.1 carboxymuconolactone decarboxylase family protein [Roseobacter sp. WL0113]